MKTVKQNNPPNIFKQAMEKVDSGLIMLDSTGKITFLNNAAKKILGLTEQQHGRTLEQVTTNTQLIETAKKALAGQAVRKKIQLFFNMRTLQMRAHPLYESTRKINGCLITLQDTTQIDALADVKKDFIANVSHDLRTPITSIRSLTEALLAGAKDDPKTLKRFLEELDHQSERLSNLARDILDLSKIENQNSLTLRKLAIGPLLKQSVNSFKNEALSKNLKINVNIKEESETKIDAEQLMKAFNNLLDNSIKYTSDKGNITVKLSADNGFIKVSFKDNGIGIPQKELPRIFERFYRVSKSRSLKSGGTGLGLSIVKHVVENHNGKIKVKSQLNKGSEFVITLPK